MYHYKESGLPNVYLANGYRKVETPYGEGIAIDNVELLHEAICNTIVEEKPALLTGPEIRFIRKYLNLTQSQLASYLGVQAQSVRRWEKLGTAPKPADRAVRMAYRDITRHYSKPLDELAKLSSKSAKSRKVQYEFLAGSNDHWRPEVHCA